MHENACTLCHALGQLWEINAPLFLAHSLLLYPRLPLTVFTTEASYISAAICLVGAIVVRGILAWLAATIGVFMY